VSVSTLMQETSKGAKRAMPTVERVIQEAIEQKIFPSAVCAVLLGGRVKYQGAFGKPDPERDDPASPSTVYDLASLTKPISTATLALLALEEGKLTLETPVTRFFPDAKHLQGVLVKHLLTHTSGLPAWRALYQNADTRDAVLQAVLNIPRTRPPSTGLHLQRPRLHPDGRDSGAGLRAVAGGAVPREDCRAVGHGVRCLLPACRVARADCAHRALRESPERHPARRSA
jgi:CubicO group peptidase (beta-lactamase class C family)